MRIPTSLSIPPTQTLGSVFIRTSGVVVAIDEDGAGANYSL